MEIDIILYWSCFRTEHFYMGIPGKLRITILALSLDFEKLNPFTNDIDNNIFKITVIGLCSI